MIRRFFRWLFGIKPKNPPVIESVYGMEAPTVPMADRRVRATRRTC